MSFPYRYPVVSLTLNHRLITEMPSAYGIMGVLPTHCFPDGKILHGVARMGVTYEARASSFSSAALGYDHKIIGCPEGARQPASFGRKRRQISEKQILAPLQGSLIHLTGPPRAALEDELALG